MATRDRVVRITAGTYERLEREAVRRGLAPDALADELLSAALAAARAEGEAVTKGDKEVLLAADEATDAEKRAAQFSRSLDEMGAPAE